MRSTEHSTGRSSAPPALCVSVHDVAPSTWPLCERLLGAIGAVADIPVTLLVVPAYHGHAGHQRNGAYESMLETQLACGHELALHGYTHFDDGPAPSNWRDRFARRVYTQDEGEFAAIGADDALERLKCGLAWFERRGWPLHGFVAPAWLLGPGAWWALAQCPFQYTTTLTHFYCLPRHQSLFAPSLVYSARNHWGRACSRSGNTLAAMLMRRLPLVRLGLHPADADSPDTVRHMQRLLEKLLANRTASTKAAVAMSWDEQYGAVKTGSMASPDSIAID